MEPMRVLPRWRSPEMSCQFVPAARRDREAMAWCSAGLVLTAWALTGGSFCFRRKDGVLTVGLAKTPASRPTRPPKRRKG